MTILCPSCRASGSAGAAVRAREGCDVPQTLGEPMRDAGARPQFRITCSRCNGADAACETCGGSGEETIYRCAGAIVDHETSELVRAWSDYEQGHLPDEGGMSDQSATFVELVGVVSREIARVRSEQMKPKKRAGPAARSSRKAPNRI